LGAGAALRCPSLPKFARASSHKKADAPSPTPHAPRPSSSYTGHGLL
jgi:hypothetical protein